MSETPLTDRALARLRAIAEGNALDIKKIELIGTEEKLFTLHAEMLMSVDVSATRSTTPGAPHAPKKGVQVVGTVAELETQVSTMKKNLQESGDWVKEAGDQIKNEPGQGFGIGQAEITLDNLVQTFSATQKCEACHGVGSNNCEACKARGTTPCKVCNATGQEICYQCQGTGKNVNAQGLQCPQCHGRGQIQNTAMQNCPQCHGRGNLQRDAQQTCPSCHGSGHHGNESCHTCQGRGSVLGRVMQTCEICHGRGQVQNMQAQQCPQCHGRGNLPPNPQQMICQICNGQMRIVCRTCNGKKEIACPSCLGKGKITCAVCHGEAKFTVEDVALPVARCEFRILESAEVPTTLRHALDRYGFKMLVKAGAKIEASRANVQENKIAKMDYTASFPFAELRLRIAGKPMRAGVVGEKAGIRDIPPFLDSTFDAELQKLEKKLGDSRGLDKAFKLRAMRELFEAMQSGGDVMLAFRRIYPIGFSDKMIERMQGLLGELVEASTFTLRATVSGLLLFAFSALFYFFIGSGVRLHVANATHPAMAFILDAVMCAGAFLLIDVTLRFTAALQLRSLAPKNTGLHIWAQRAGSLGISVSVCAALIYVGLLWFLKATPGF